MRILLTGATGYIGTVMAPRLLAAGHEVTGLDAGWFADRVLGPLADHVPMIWTDLRDIELDQLAGYDAVVHLAALSNDPLGALAPGITHEINHRSSVRLARMAKQAGIGRFVYASTCSVYGAAGGAGLVDEQAPMAPVTAYAESKVAVEAELVRLNDDSFVTTALRNATAFGFSPRLRADIVLNNLVGHAVLTGQVLVLSDGSPWRPLVHVSDICEAFTAVLAAPSDVVGGRAFNVGDEKNNVTVAQIAEEVVAAVPDAELVITGEFGGDPRSYRVDFSAIREAIPGFRCTRTVADGAAELVESYRLAGLTRHGFDHDFVRLRVIEELQRQGRLGADLRATKSPIGAGTQGSTGHGIEGDRLVDSNSP